VIAGNMLIPGPSQPSADAYRGRGLTSPAIAAVLLTVGFGIELRFHSD